MLASRFERRRESHAAAAIFRGDDAGPTGALSARGVRQRAVARPYVEGHRHRVAFVVSHNLLREVPTGVHRVRRLGEDDGDRAARERVEEAAARRRVAPRLQRENGVVVPATRYSVEVFLSTKVAAAPRPRRGYSVAAATAEKNFPEKKFSARPRVRVPRQNFIARPARVDAVLRRGALLHEHGPQRRVPAVAEAVLGPSGLRGARPLGGPAAKFR